MNIRKTATCRLQQARQVSIAISCICLLLVSCSIATAQMGVPRGGSPLYSSKPYEPSAPNGLPAALKQVGIDQKLNQQLPADATFKDETGAVVKLGNYFGKRPIVMSLVYYDCPMLCTQILNGMIASFKTLSLKPGEDFDVVSISFDSRETPALAAAKKNVYVNYLPETKRAGANNGWHFLTGDDENIKRITDAVGFRYRFDQATKQFAHASAIYVVTPEGKLSHYFYGIEYAPRDLRLALVEASQNKIGSAVDQLMLYCYHYDPSTGRYGAVVLNIVRLGGVVTLICIGFMFLLLRRWNATRIHVQAGGAT
ncbi:MAG TPA: SCO family protein [Pyrinomonadaceae bacterium]|jgi:protein SCO1/2